MSPLCSVLQTDNVQVENGEHFFSFFSLDIFQLWSILSSKCPRNQILTSEQPPGHCLVQIFSRYKLSLTMDANHKMINFVEVTLYLNSTHHCPYMKPNNTLKYINMESNIPPTILKNAPPNITDRISRNSTNEETLKLISNVQTIPGCT